VSYPNKIKLKSLKGTRDFYIRKLIWGNLTEPERNSLSVALDSINRIIEEEENLRENRKHKAVLSKRGI